MKPQAIFFDLFETLITEFEDGARITPRGDHDVGALGLTAQAFKEGWRQRQEGRMTGAYASYPEVVRDILKEQGLPVPEQTVQQLYDRRIAEKSVPFRLIRADILDMLASLRREQITLGLISNCTEEEVRAWPGSLLATYFDEVVFSYQAGAAKPDLHIYALACDRLKVQPEQCLFIGDGGSDELDGASRAGLRAYHAVWFNRHIRSDYPKLSSPNEVLQSAGIELLQ